MGLIPYGVISKSHGFGEGVRLVPYSRDLSNLAFIKSVYIKTGGSADFKKYTILGRSISRKYAILDLEGLETFEQAQELRGKEVFVQTEQLSGPSEDEYYFFELIGLSVFSTDNKLLGKVSKITDSAQNILVVEMLSGKQSLIPFTEPIVKEVDVINKRIVIDPPVGLLEL